MAILRFARDELIEALEGRREWAERLDAEHLAEHQRAEKAFLAKFRASCREAVKWDYQTAKEHYFQVMEGVGRYGSGQPNCPSSLVAKLDRNLSVVRASRQKTFQVSDGGAWSSVYYLLTHDETIKAEMCQ